MCIRDPLKRYSADEALAHPWIAGKNSVTRKLSKELEAVTFQQFVKALFFVGVIKAQADTNKVREHLKKRNKDGLMLSDSKVREARNTFFSRRLPNFGTFANASPKEKLGQKNAQAGGNLIRLKKVITTQLRLSIPSEDYNSNVGSPTKRTLRGVQRSIVTQKIRNLGGFSRNRNPTICRTIENSALNLCSIDKPQNQSRLVFLRKAMEFNTKQQPKSQISRNTENLKKQRTSMITPDNAKSLVKTFREPDKEDILIVANVLKSKRISQHKQTSIKSGTEESLVTSKVKALAPLTKVVLKKLYRK